MLRSLKNTFKSAIKSLEILYVLENSKPCARILANEDELKKIFDCLHNNSLEFSISNFKLKKINNEGYYSDKSVKIRKDSLEKGYFILYISKVKELCEKAKAYEENGMHFELGMVLGYPKCCCKFFSENFNEDNYDLTLNILKNSGGFEFPFYANIAARHFDVSLLSHFPCSFNCKYSINIAKENLEIIKGYSIQKAEIFENIMKSAVLYTQNGIFLLKNHKKAGNEIGFEDVLATAKDKLYNELMANKKIGIVDKNKIKVGNNEVANTGLMVFT